MYIQLVQNASLSHASLLPQTNDLIFFFSFNMSLKYSSQSLRVFLSFTLLTTVPNVSGNKKTNNYQAAHIPGKITLGGLFPIHSQDKNGNCRIINGILGIQRLEAIMYDIRRINPENKILPGITLGMSAFDTCASETKALDRTVEEFITHQKCDSKKEEGVIGERQVII